MKVTNKRFGMLVLLTLAAGLLLASGCSSVNFDKEAVGKVKKVAVVMYTVPTSIEYYDDAQDHQKTLLQIAAALATINNGQQAATISQKTFITELNRQGLGFKAISQAEMMNNTAFLKISNKYVAARMEQKAAAEEKKSGAMKALSMLSALGGGGSMDIPEGIGPEGQPEFGLITKWITADGALMGGEGEMAYIKEAIAALGVDAALVINDQGYSFSCEICVGGTGSGSTGSAFLISIVDRNGKEILGMREWFAFQPRSAAMAVYIVNPLQHDSLFEGHGIKTARVFADLFREESKE